MCVYVCDHIVVYESQFFYVGLVYVWSSLNAYKCVDRFAVNDLQSIVYLPVYCALQSIKSSVIQSVNRFLFFWCKVNNKIEKKIKWDSIELHSLNQVPNKNTAENICDRQKEKKIWNIESETLSSLASISLMNGLCFVFLWSDAVHMIFFSWRGGLEV